MRQTARRFSSPCLYCKHPLYHLPFIKSTLCKLFKCTVGSSFKKTLVIYVRFVPSPSRWNATFQLSTRAVQRISGKWIYFKKKSLKLRNIKLKLYVMTGRKKKLNHNCNFWTRWHGHSLLVNIFCNETLSLKKDNLRQSQWFILLYTEGCLVIAMETSQCHKILSAIAAHITGKRKEGSAAADPIRSI